MSPILWIEGLGCVLGLESQATSVEKGTLELRFRLCGHPSETGNAGPIRCTEFHGDVSSIFD